MAIKSKDEILNSIKAKIGEDTSDESIALIEDISDTLTDFETKTKDSTDWKEKYEQNDKEWREKYRDRFFSSENTEPDVDIGGKSDEPLKYENLFKEV